MAFLWIAFSNQEGAAFERLAAGRRLGRMLEDDRQRVVRLLADFGVPVAAPRLGHRAAVDYAAAADQSPAEHDPRGRAAEEIAALWSAVGALAGLTPARPESRDGAFD